jgi:uncharacterized membrane protein YfcA
MDFSIEMLLIGVGVGLISNALGLGGGVLMVPAFLEFVDGMDTNTAKGTSLLIIVFVAMVNAWRLNVGIADKQYRAALCMGSGSIVGAFAGSWLTGILAEHVVLWVFIAFIGMVGVRAFFIEPPKVMADQVRQRVGAAVTIGLVAGLAGGATGTGGGAVLVPLVLIAGLATNERVVALSNMVMVATSIAAVAAHMAATQTTGLPSTMGQVHFAIVPMVIVGALLSAPVGRMINARLSLKKRRLILGMVLLSIMVRLIVDRGF